jgi:hypothetical protein
MRKRYSTGGIKKQRGRWIGMWWLNGKRRSRVLGLVKKMSKTEAREAVKAIVTEENAKRETHKVWQFGEFVEQIYFPYYSRKWKHSTRENNVNRVSVHLVGAFTDRELGGLKRDELSGFAGPEGQESVVLGRRSSAVGPKADFRYGRG